MSDTPIIDLTNTPDTFDTPDIVDLSDSPSSSSAFISTPRGKIRATPRKIPELNNDEFDPLLAVYSSDDDFNSSNDAVFIDDEAQASDMGDDRNDSIGSLEDFVVDDEVVVRTLKRHILDPGRRKRSKKMVDWYFLDNPLWMRILGHLAFYDLLFAAQSCRRFYTMVCPTDRELAELPYSPTRPSSKIFWRPTLVKNHRCFLVRSIYPLMFHNRHNAGQFDSASFNLHTDKLFKITIFSEVRIVVVNDHGGLSTKIKSMGSIVLNFPLVSINPSS